LFGDLLHDLPDRLADRRSRDDHDDRQGAGRAGAGVGESGKAETGDQAAD
jgi:hypothetical protein